MRHRIPITREPAIPIVPNGYYHTDSTLYRVEHVSGRRALVEDCRTADLIDIAIEELAKLTPVKRAA
jgi:hypothetical protein